MANNLFSPQFNPQNPVGGFGDAAKPQIIQPTNANTPLKGASSVHGGPPPVTTDTNLAADVIRDKVARLYAGENVEPNASTEAQEAEAAKPAQRSKHQQFMHELSTSGKDLATVQTEWHNYYLALGEQERHEVWHEFYSSQASVTQPTILQPGQATVGASVPTTSGEAQVLAEHKQQAAQSKHVKRVRHQGPKLINARSVRDVQAVVKDKVTAGGTLQARHHLQALLFGLGVGVVVVVIFLFSFFNQIIIAPFIQPGRASAATPLIINDQTVAASSTPEVIIPKINVEIPVNFNETSTNEADIENDLMGGVVHYPTTVLPGQNGNAAFFGHSSNNILNKGKYKFAFVLLHTMVPGDTFYITNNKKVYVYQVISKTVVDPSDVGVLGPVPGQTATATLITCDPPGTSLRRLVLVGKQISPDPSTNSATSAATATGTTGNPTSAGTTAAKQASAVGSLPGNGPTLWQRTFTNGFGKGLGITVLLACMFISIRWLNSGVKDIRTLRRGRRT